MHLKAYPKDYYQSQQFLLGPLTIAESITAAPEPARSPALRALREARRREQGELW